MTCHSSAKSDLAIDGHGNEQRIDHRDAGGLGRREHAAVNAAENNDDGADRPARLLGRGPDILPARRRRQRHHFDPRIDHHVDRVDDADQKARQDASGEQLYRRDLRRHCIKNHRDRRRNDHRDGAGRRDQAHRKALAVAVLGERGKQQPADGDHGADGCMRHGAEQFRGRHRRHRERAAYAADDRYDPGDDSIGNAAAAHDLTGQHKKRHRQQREIVE